ncbi:MAG: hypothetical protein LWY06_04365 [Firmicutes bacterium]|nr:hypothetical protein [Bacillota bacterium]
MITLTCPDCEAKNEIDDDSHRFTCSQCRKNYFIDNINSISYTGNPEKSSDNNYQNSKSILIKSEKQSGIDNYDIQNEELQKIGIKIRELEKLSRRKIDDIPRQPHLPECRTGIWVGLAIISVIGLVYFTILEQGINIYVVILGVCVISGISKIINCIRSEKETFELYEENMRHYEAEIEKYEKEVSSLLQKIKLLKEQKEHIIKLSVKKKENPAQSISVSD